jgi:Zn-dependent protease
MSAGGDEATSVSTHEVTRFLQAWGLGDETAIEQLMPLVYNELHRLAHCYMAGEHPGQLAKITKVESPRPF